jgi:DNA topoisomerase IB
MIPTMSEYIDSAKTEILTLITESKPLTKKSDTPRAFTALLKTKANFKAFVKKFAGKENIDSRSNVLSYIVRDALYDKTFDLTQKLIDLESFLRKTYRENYPEDTSLKLKIKEQKIKQFEKDVRGAVQAQSQSKKDYLSIFTAMGTKLKQLASSSASPREFTVQLKNLGNTPGNSIHDFISQYFIGSDNEQSRINTFIYTIRDVYIKPNTVPGKVLPSTPSEWFDLKLAGIVKSSHKSKILNEERDALTSVIPQTFLKFLPKTLIVEVDKNNKITALKSKFAEKLDDIAAKIERQKILLTNLTKLETKIKKDLVSPDHDTKMKALLVYLMLDTGIRPGDEDNKVKIDVEKDEDGEEIDQYLETYGATTLNKHHIKFIRANFVRLEFVGKKGIINLADITDSTLTKAITDLVNKTKANKKSNYLFLDKEGKVFGQPKVTDYLRSIVPGLNLTDFRKLKSTRVFLDALREKRTMILGMIYDITQDQVANAKEEIMEVIRDVVDQAYRESVHALSHQSMNTTIKSYINPQVLLNFLSTGKVADKIEDIVFKDQKLVFDPQVFITQAIAYGKATDDIIGPEDYVDYGDDDPKLHMIKKAKWISKYLSRLSYPFVA